jgi:hypothetical protein
MPPGRFWRCFSRHQPLAGDFVSELEYNPRPYGEAKNEEDGKEEELLPQDAL